MRSGAKDASSMPMFFENDDISGRVEIDLDKAESVKSITITVSFSILHSFLSNSFFFEIESVFFFFSFFFQIQAGTTFVGQDELIFFKETQTLWTPNAESGPKLKGKHSWPFKFVLKPEVPMKEEKKDGMMYRLPPNFTERASPAYIDYKLIVTVQRGMLRVNQVYAVSEFKNLTHIAKKKLKFRVAFRPT